MKIGLLGTGFGVAHAQIYYRHPRIDEVVVFGRTPAKLDKIAGERHPRHPRRPHPTEREHRGDPR